MSVTTEASVGAEFRSAVEEAVPALGTFFRRVKSTLDHDDPSSFWRCRPALEELLQTEFLAPLVNHELDLILSDPRHVPPGVSADGQWLLGHVEGCALIVRLIVGTGQGLVNRAVSVPSTP